MMAGRTYGKGFKGALNYNEDKNHLHDKDVTILEAHGVTSWVEGGRICMDSDEVAREFRMQANLDPDFRKPVANWWQAYKPEDTPMLTDELMCQIAKEHISEMAVRVIGWETLSHDKKRALTAEEALKERERLRAQGKDGKLPKRPILEKIPLDELQFVIVRHGEKEHQHTHTLLNLVTTKGDRIYTGNDLYRNEAVCKGITSKYGLAWGVEKSKRKPSKAYKTSGREARDYVAKAVRRYMYVSTSAAEYVSKLASLGISAKVGKDSKGKIVTVSYAYTTKDGVQHTFKGSDLGKGYSGGYLRKALEANAAKEVKAAQRRKTDLAPKPRMAEMPNPTHMTQGDVEAEIKAVLSAVGFQSESINFTPGIGPDGPLTHVNCGGVLVTVESDGQVFYTKRGWKYPLRDHNGHDVFISDAKRYQQLLSRMTGLVPSPYNRSKKATLKKNRDEVFLQRNSIPDDVDRDEIDRDDIKPKGRRI